MRKLLEITPEKWEKLKSLSGNEKNPYIVISWSEQKVMALVYVNQSEVFLTTINNPRTKKEDYQPATEEQWREALTKAKTLMNKL